MTRVERYDRDWSRIVGDDGVTVAGIGRLSNGSWSVFDTFDNRLTKKCFGTVPKAFDWWCLNAASGMEAATAGETVQHGSTEGDSPTAESGDAHD